MADPGSSPDRTAGCSAHPSPVAVDRLRRALRAELAAYAEDLDQELHDGLGGRRDVGATAPPSAPADRLEAFQRRIQRLVAGAVAEREAEAVLAAASSQAADQQADGPAAGPHPTAAPPVARGSARGPARRARRLALGAVVGLLLAAVTGQRLAGG